MYMVVQTEKQLQVLQLQTLKDHFTRMTCNLHLSTDKQIYFSYLTQTYLEVCSNVC